MAKFWRSNHDYAHLVHLGKDASRCDNCLGRVKAGSDGSNKCSSCHIVGDTLWKEDQKIKEKKKEQEKGK